MKVIIIEDKNKVNNSKASQSEMLYSQLKKKGIDVHLIESDPQYITKPLSTKQMKKYFI